VTWPGASSLLRLMRYGGLLLVVLVVVALALVVVVLMAVNAPPPPLLLARQSTFWNVVFVAVARRRSGTVTPLRALASAAASRLPSPVAVEVVVLRRSWSHSPYALAHAVSLSSRTVEAAMACAAPSIQDAIDASTFGPGEGQEEQERQHTRLQATTFRDQDRVSRSS
jgi:hypothetical protein